MESSDTTGETTSTVSAKPVPEIPVVRRRASKKSKRAAKRKATDFAGNDVNSK